MRWEVDDRATRGHGEGGRTAGVATPIATVIGWKAVDKRSYLRGRVTPEAEAPEPEARPSPEGNARR